MKWTNIIDPESPFGFSINVIDTDGVETPIGDWNPKFNDRAVFIRLSSPMLQGNDIVVAKEFPKIKEVKWQAKDIPWEDRVPCQAGKYWNKEDEADTDMDGYGNTMRAIAEAGRNWKRKFPVLAAAYAETRRFRGMTVHGYVPSMGQLRTMYTYRWVIEMSLERIGNRETSLNSYGIYISSTEDSTSSMMALDVFGNKFQGTTVLTHTMSKNGWHTLVPLFKI